MSRDEIYERTLKHLFAPVADLLFQDPTVSEVLINGPNRIYVERAGVLQLQTGRHFGSEAALMRAATNLAEYVGRRLDRSLDARLPKPFGFRAHVILPPAAKDGIHLSIRKFREDRLTADELVADGTMTMSQREILQSAVAAKRNVVIAGGTNTGKTTLLGALAEAIPAHQRIIVIEDTSELRLPHEHVVTLEAQSGKTIRDLFVDSLRMRPDRIIVGEVRRGEALDLVQSMLSGHDGALSTVHASSPVQALMRLETLCLMSDAKMPIAVARRQVASAVHLVAQVAWAGTKQRLVEIAEITGCGRTGYRIRPVG